MNNWDSLHVGHRFELAFPVLGLNFEDNMDFGIFDQSVFINP
jgi:hypothetical protein